MEIIEISPTAIKFNCNILTPGELLSGETSICSLPLISFLLSPQVPEQLACEATENMEPGGGTSQLASPPWADSFGASLHHVWRESLNLKVPSPHGSARSKQNTAPDSTLDMVSRCPCIRGHSCCQAYSISQQKHSLGTHGLSLKPEHSLEIAGSRLASPLCFIAGYQGQASETWLSWVSSFLQTRCWVWPAPSPAPAPATNYVDLSIVSIGLPPERCLFLSLFPSIDCEVLKESVNSCTLT